jgi:small subunit ribosomal protein S9
MTAKTASKDSYLQAVGRRKTSVARIRLFEVKGAVTVNDKDVASYFPTRELQKIIDEAFKVAGVLETLRTTVHVSGGGIHSQAEAIRHGIARVLIVRDATLRKTVKKAGLLKRDPRAKERRKFGLKKARKAPQWSKR